MKKAIAVIFTSLAAMAVIVGYVAGKGDSSGPLNYIFVVILGVPWNPLLSWLVPSIQSPIIPLIGLFVNLSIVWWWALRKKRSE